MDALVDKYTKIMSLTAELANEIKEIENLDEKIDTLNFVRGIIHEVSPYKNHPVDYVYWEKSEQIEANEYNPNFVAPPEMKLLITSIEDDGFTMPIYTNPEENVAKIIDGFHRRKSITISTKINDSTYGRLPITKSKKDQRDIASRMASTIRHNRARGSHDVGLMSEIVSELVQSGMSDVWIMKKIGMDADELLRLKQITGLAALFASEEFSEVKDGEIS